MYIIYCLIKNLTLYVHWTIKNRKYEIKFLKVPVGGVDASTEEHALEHRRGDGHQQLVSLYID